MTDEIRDITIIGGGPTGLFAAFYAGMRGTSVRIVDSLPELGGQLTALYPEKYIFDVGGFPKVRAKELAMDLVSQAMQFEPQVELDQEVREVEEEPDGTLRLRCRSGDFLTRALVIAGGKGAFEPRRLEVPGYDEFLGKGVHYAVKNPADFEGKRIMIVGGGDSALDWALILKDHAERLVVAHRRDAFRAHEKSVDDLMKAEAAGEVELRLFHEVAEIRGDGTVNEVTVFDNRTDDRTTMEMDTVLTFLGFKPDLGPIQRWGLEVRKNRLLVNNLMETNRAGIYAAGDIVDYEGKLDLIVSGFSEAAIAVNNAVHHVNPDARVNPGHSTNMKVFK
ncbi:MAG: NAD(P)/FAD-dependent oxidoreductase [Gemmatimonadales bacterium]|nr:MAG: NAD(P)/FAD-dependent oxidoreductase [Gemmatimonadales bacterium]